MHVRIQNCHDHVHQTINHDENLENILGEVAKILLWMAQTASPA